MPDASKIESDEPELYLGIYEGKLRYFTLDGDLVPTPEEAQGCFILL